MNEYETVPVGLVRCHWCGTNYKQHTFQTPHGYHWHCWPRSWPWRWSRNLRVAWCHLRLRHGKPPDDGWGTALNGMVDIYCGGCGARYTTMPLDDYNENRRVIEVLRDATGMEDV